MRMCLKHWDALQDGLKQRGIYGLVPRNGNEAAESLINRIGGQPEDTAYDPLMSCNLMIIENAILRLGPGILSIEGCPVCEILRLHQEWIDQNGGTCPNGCSQEELEVYWIESPLDAALKYVMETPALRTLAGI